MRLQIAADQLFYIRLQQVFGLLSLLYWYAALIISPIGYVIGKHRMRYIEFARRGIGVSAFYFALLHGTVALFRQLGGPGQLQHLPSLFQWSLLGGAIGFGVLTIMAATSFDKVVDFMTFRRWKWLHRLTYIGGILVMLHIWTIGTHMAYTGVQLAVFTALVILSGLESFRVITLLSRKYKDLARRDYFTMLFLSLWIGWAVAIAAVPAVVGNYHSRHDDHASGGRSH